jgi:hypothetical protein
LAEELHPATVGVGEAAEDREERGLPGPVRAEQAEEFARLNREGDAIQRDVRAVPLANVGDFEDAFRHGDYYRQAEGVGHWSLVIGRWSLVTRGVSWTVTGC